MIQMVMLWAAQDILSRVCAGRSWQPGGLGLIETGLPGSLLTGTLPVFRLTEGTLSTSITHFTDEEMETQKS